MSRDRDHPAPLRLRAEDEADLKVVSAALQDAVATLGDVRFEKPARRFTLALNRFRWEAGGDGRGQRVRCGVQIGGVLTAQAKRVKQDAPDAVISLLSLTFEPGPEAPGGWIVLSLSGGGEIRLQVECVDVVMADLTAPWRARRRPEHPLDEGAGAGGSGDGEGAR